MLHRAYVGYPDRNDNPLPPLFPPLAPSLALPACVGWQASSSTSLSRRGSTSASPLARARAASPCSRASSLGCSPRRRSSMRVRMRRSSARGARGGEGGGRPTQLRSGRINHLHPPRQTVPLSPCRKQSTGLSVRRRNHFHVGEALAQPGFWEVDGACHWSRRPRPRALFVVPPVSVPPGKRTSVHAWLCGGWCCVRTACLWRASMARLYVRFPSLPIPYPLPDQSWEKG